MLDPEKTLIFRRLYLFTSATVNIKEGWNLHSYLNENLKLHFQQTVFRLFPSFPYNISEE
jgi:hypothetical protein